MKYVYEDIPEFFNKENFPNINFGKIEKGKKSNVFDTNIIYHAWKKYVGLIDYKLNQCYKFFNNFSEELTIPPYVLFELLYQLEEENDRSSFIDFLRKKDSIRMIRKKISTKHLTDIPKEKIEKIESHIGREYPTKYDSVLNRISITDSYILKFCLIEKSLLYTIDRPLIDAANFVGIKTKTI